MQSGVRTTALALVAATLLGAAHAVLAQAWPSRPIRIMVPFPAGNAGDVTARSLTDRLGQRLGQSFIVENRAGAQGAIGVDAVAKAAPDGHTLLVTSLSPLVITPHVSKNLSYDPMRDLTPVALIGWTGMILVAPVSLPVNSVQELLAYAKSNPGKLSYASLAPAPFPC